MTGQDYASAAGESASRTGGQVDDLRAVREHLAQLRADLRTLKHDVEAIRDGDVGRAAARTITQAVSTVEEAAERAYDRLSRQTQTYASSFERTVSEHPYGATAMAVAAGMCLSRFLDRPRR
jgi:ElaB/YqjD/DUF883 family membrane-anchored ribosome-binding protein